MKLLLVLAICAVLFVALFYVTNGLVGALSIACIVAVLVLITLAARAMSEM
jgi:hypothetical protein